MLDNIYDRVNDYSCVHISLASPNDIRSWSFGEVKKIKDRKTGEYRAMKIIDQTNCQKTDSYVDEIEIIKRLV